MSDDNTDTAFMTLQTDPTASGADAEELVAVEAEADEEVKRSIPEGFQIDSPEKVSWLLRRINNARRYRERVKNWAAAETRRADREEEQLLFLFGNALRLWVTCELGRLKGRRKSLDLPGGCVGYRRESEKVVIEDEAAVIEWATSACPQAVVMVPRLSWTVLKAHIATTGECPPTGLRIEPAAEKFFIH